MKKLIFDQLYQFQTRRKISILYRQFLTIQNANEINSTKRSSKINKNAKKIDSKKSTHFE